MNMKSLNYVYIKRCAVSGATHYSAVFDVGSADRAVNKIDSSEILKNTTLLH